MCFTDTRLLISFKCILEYFQLDFPLYLYILNKSLVSGFQKVSFAASFVWKKKKIISNAKKSSLFSQLKKCYKSFPFFAYSFLCWMVILRFQVSLLFSYTEHVTQAVNVSNGAFRSAQGQTSLPLALAPRKWLCRCSSVCPT